MSTDMVEMRLVRETPWRVVSEWSAELDTRDGEQLRDALVGALKGHLGEHGDWKAALPHYLLQWRWNSSTGWRSWRAAK